MIVAVEGVSAAGKSTWCATHARGVTVPELRFPDPESALALEEAGAAVFWSLVNAARWRLALDMERQNGIAVCDEDPFKLHYAFCLWRIGATPRERFDEQAAAVRARFAAGTLGFADLVLFKDIDAVTLRRQRDDDPTKRRSRFELHARMLAPLKEWYQALAALRPGRVLFGLPADGLKGLQQLPAVPAADRSDVALLERLLLAVA